MITPQEFWSLLAFLLACVSIAIQGYPIVFKILQALLAFFSLVDVEEEFERLCGLINRLKRRAKYTLGFIPSVENSRRSKLERDGW